MRLWIWLEAKFGDNLLVTKEYANKGCSILSINQEVKISIYTNYVSIPKIGKGKVLLFIISNVSKFESIFHSLQLLLQRYFSFWYKPSQNNENWKTVDTKPQYGCFEISSYIKA